MSTRRRLVTVLLTVALMAAAGSVYAGAQRETAAADEPVMLTYWIQLHTDAARVLDNFAENLGYQKIMEITGIDVQFIHPPQGQEVEQFNLIIASGDLPDMIVDHGYPGGPDRAIEDGVYLRLNELIEAHAPNYARVRDSQVPPEIADLQAITDTTGEIGNQTITDAGNVWAFTMIQPELQLPWFGPVMRADWLDELGLDVPTTMDEWEHVLTVFRDEKGAEAPLSLISNLPFGSYGLFTGAYDFGGYGWTGNQHFYRDDGIVRYAPLEQAFRDYLVRMRRWYDEGLLDPDFMTRDWDGQIALQTGGGAGAWSASYGSHIDAHLVAMRHDPDYAIVAVPYPSLNPGETPRMREQGFYNQGYNTAVTTASRHPEEAVRWLDFGYSAEGYMIYNWGIEGVSYTMVDGRPQFTELVANNPDGLPYSQAIWKYKMHVGSYLRDWRSVPPWRDEVVHAMEVWSEADAELNLPMISFTPEESRELSRIMSDITTFVDERTVRLVVGADSFDDYDAFVSQLRRMNIDRAIEIQQGALDRYLAR